MPPAPQNSPNATIPKAYLSPAPSTAAARTREPNVGTEDQNQTVPYDGQVNQILRQFLDRLQAELPMTIANVLQKQMHSAEITDGAARIAEVGSVIKQRTSQLLSDFSSNVQSELAKVRLDLKQVCKGTSDDVTATWDEEVRNSNLSAVLRKKIHDVSREIEKSAKDETHRVIREMKKGIRKLEGEQVAFRLPTLKRKDDGATTEHTNAQLQELGMLMLRKAITPEAVSRLTDDLKTLEAREHLLDDLPSLFDYVDTELKNCERNSNDPNGAAVRKVLERIRNRVKNWLDRNKIEAFPEVGAAFEYQMHECIGKIPAAPNDAESVGQVASVDTKGYRFTDSEFPLRRARVILYGKPAEL